MKYFVSNSNLTKSIFARLIFKKIIAQRPKKSFLIELPKKIEFCMRNDNLI